MLQLVDQRGQVSACADGWKRGRVPVSRQETQCESPITVQVSYCGAVGN